MEDNKTNNNGCLKYILYLIGVPFYYASFYSCTGSFKCINSDAKVYLRFFIYDILDYCKLHYCKKGLFFLCK